MEDYQDKIKCLILAYFTPNPTNSQSAPEYKTTQELMAMLSGIIPQQHLVDYTLSEVLNDSGFQTELTPTPAELSEDFNLKEVFLWKMYRNEF